MFVEGAKNGKACRSAINGGEITSVIVLGAGGISATSVQSQQVQAVIGAATLGTRALSSGCLATSIQSVTHNN